MTRIAIDLQTMFQRQFGSKPLLPKEQALSDSNAFKINGKNSGNLSSIGSSLTADYNGREIWLPVRFCGLDQSKFGRTELFLPYTVIKLSAKKTIVKTPLAERAGTVKELYSIEDYSINLKGFIIGYDKSGVYPIWPEEDLKLLRSLWELNEAVELDNALTNIFLGSENSGKVVIESLDLPEAEGGKTNVRPFNLTLESDTIFKLEL